MDARQVWDECPTGDGAGGPTGLLLGGGEGGEGGGVVQVSLLFREERKPQSVNSERKRWL